MFSNIIEQTTVDSLQQAFVDAFGPFFSRFGINIADHAMLVMLIFVAVIGLLHCLFGYKLLRLWVGLFGFRVGFRVAWLFMERLNINPTTGVIISLIAGVALCMVAALLFKVGIFAFSTYIGGVLALYVFTEYLRYFDDKRTIMIIFVVAIALAIGGIAVHFMRPILIVLTAIVGGLVVAVVLAIIFNMTETFDIFLIGGLVLAILGTMFQFSVTKD